MQSGTSWTWRSTRFVLGALFVAPFLGVVPALAQDDPAPPTALSHKVLPLDQVGRFDAPVVDRDAAALVDTEREREGLPPRYAISHPVMMTPATHGTWEQLDPDTRLWRFVIASSGATSLDLGFTRYQMPAGGRLMVYASDFSQIVRPFTDRDNETHGELWTPVVLSEEMVVEVTIPNDAVNRLDLELTVVNVGYRGFGAAMSEGGARSGSCNVDVVCPEGDGWPLEIQAVAVIGTGGGTFCTGFMVNNTAQDLRNYFMTANHCGINSGNAASLRAYWNYENSWCRPPGGGASGGPGDGSLSQFNTGSWFRASNSPSDMTLVELDDDPNPAWDVAYAGWYRGSADATSAVGIHQPNTDEKRISFENDPTTTTTYLGTSIPGDGTHVRVTDWDLGTTEPGSSGSPLFNQDHQVIGQLHGGYASCTSQTSDWYGRFSVSWSALSPHLDPGGTGLVSVDSISLNTLCSSAGEISLDRANYGCEDVVSIRVVDCDLNVNDTVVDTATATLSSDTEGAGETVVLTETAPSSGRFEGSMILSATDSAGVVQVSPGDIVTAHYLDADDGSGGTNVDVTTTAGVDCTAPIISNVQITNLQPRSVTVVFNTDEPSVGTVRYGLSCGALTGSATGSGLSTSPSVDVTGLQDGTQYFFAVDAADEAGNTRSDDNGGNCYTFTTEEVPNFFTEEFSGDLDLDNWSLLFEPNGSVDFYSGCAEEITALPTDPSGGSNLSLPDDGSSLVSVSGGQTVSIYGTSYSSFYAGSNGYITFGGGDSDYTDSLADHFGMRRISALFEDLNPSAGGTVSWLQLADHMAVTFQNVPEYNTSNSNTFQVELFFNGDIQISYLAVDATSGIAGLSGGGGVSPDFFETDLTTMGTCAFLDCNGNGADDVDDIANGTSLDCDRNHIPDECDIADGTSEDCNSNGVPDECDISSGSSLDGDGNGIPDECEITPPIVADEGARYIAVTPQASRVPESVALLVTGDPQDSAVSCVSLYAQGGATPGLLGPTAVFQTPAEWGTVHVYGKEVMPDTSYMVQVELESGSLSGGVSVTTWHWGDVDNDGNTGFLDILLMVEGFKDDYSNATVQAMDQEPCEPDGTIGFSDMLDGVFAFKDLPYSGKGCSIVCP